MHTSTLANILAHTHTYAHTYPYIFIHTDTDDKRPLRFSSTMMEAKHWPSRKGETRRSRLNSLDVRAISTNELTLDASSSSHLPPCASYAFWQYFVTMIDKHWISSRIAGQNRSVDWSNNKQMQRIHIHIQQWGDWCSVACEHSLWQVYGKCQKCQRSAAATMARCDAWCSARARTPQQGNQSPSMRCSSRRCHQCSR